MYNETLRKITSLSLLTILLTSTAAFALPTAMPQAHAQVASHPNLFVSAENSQYNNYFAGPQVVQVVVADPDINRLDQAYGEPVVTVNGKRLRMAQGTDGNWYGYFADRNQAIQAGKTSGTNSTGLNFGLFCGPTSTIAPKAGVDYTQTKGFTIARDAVTSSSPNHIVAGNSVFTGQLVANSTSLAVGSITNVCNTVTTTGLLPGAFITSKTQPQFDRLTQNGVTTNVTTIEHVIRENKTLNTQTNGFNAGAVYAAIWPVIQLYDFSAIPTAVTVDYAKSGGDQVVNLTFDRIPTNLISVTPDRNAYPENAQVFLAMNDPQLNVDPTEEDSWTWGANATNSTLYYEAFTRNGLPDADGTVDKDGRLFAMQNLVGNLTNFMFNHNGKFTLNPAAQNVRIIDLQSNGKQIVEKGGSFGSTKALTGDPSRTITGGTTSSGALYTGNIGINSEPITFIEQGGVNTGVFGNWDSAKTSTIVTLTPLEEGTVNAAALPSTDLLGSIRGQSATFKYNDIGGSIVGGFAFGSLTETVTNNTWASGQRVPVTLTDADSNRNSKLAVHLNLYDPNVARFTTMKIGTPFTLSTPTSQVQLNGTGIATALIVPDGINFARVHAGQYNLTKIGNVLAAKITANATGRDIAIDEVQSGRPIFNFTNATGTSSFNGLLLRQNATLFVDLKTTWQTLFNTINNPAPTTTSTNKFKGFDLLSYDLRSFGTLNGANVTASGVNIYLINSTAASVTSAGTAGAIIGGGNGPGGSSPQFELTTGTTAAAGGRNAGPVTFISIANTTSLQGVVNLNGSQNTVGTSSQPGTRGNVDALTALKNIFAVPSTNSLGIAFQLQYSASTKANVPTKDPVVADFFSIGITGDGIQNSQRINNAVYRWELEESMANTNVFSGTSQYLMLNQLNIFDPNTYSQLRTINHDVLFVAIQDMLQAEARAPQLNFLDLGADGVNTVLSAQQDIPTHTGIVSFDQKTYKIADTVTVTVNDQDLNTNNDLVVIYTAVRPVTSLNTVQDPATDTIGLGNLGQYSDSRAIGRLLDVQFGQQDIRWSNSNIQSHNVSPDGNTGPCFGGNTIADDNNTGTGLYASSLSASGFSLVETAAGSGLFKGTFEVPDKICQSGNAGGSTGSTTINGLNMKVNYVDFRDESGKLVEVSDNAGIRGNTGTVKLDKAVYPVPFGSISSTGSGTKTSPALANFNIPSPTSTASETGVFPLHKDQSGTGLTSSNVLPTGITLVHVRVNDPDYSQAGTGTSFINTGVWSSSNGNGPVAFQISRQGQSVLLATAGGPKALQGVGIGIVDLGSTALPAQGATTWNSVRELGPMAEISPGAGIFQADLPIELTDGPRASSTVTCPSVDYFDSLNGTTGFFGSTTHSTSQVATTVKSSNVGGESQYTQGEFSRFAQPHTQTVSGDSNTGNYCVNQGDVLTVTYLDTADASGKQQTVTDSATFDLRNGVLQSDKSVYIIGSDMILTLVEPDINLDSQTAETATLDLVEWDSHAFKNTMGPLGGATSNFDPKPTTFVETGKDTGIFQSVIKIPKQLGTGNTLLERGEQIHLEYTDWGPAGSKTVGTNNQDIELTIYTSNFGATVELDQKVYTWTDRVYMTVVAPDHNFDPNLIDIIGDNAENKVTVSTRGNSLNYKISETGVDTGIFTGYVILTGSSTLKSPGGVDGDGTEPSGTLGNGATTCPSSNPCGPTDGFLPAQDSDGVSVSFEFTRDQTVTGSALIRWNIGEIKWLQPSYPANGQGVLQIVDPDMNLNPKAVDKFDTNVWSDSDSGGIKLTMTETGQDTGIFQGTVYFTTNFQSSGNRLHVAEGDTVTGEYKDRTLPPPYTPADQLRLTATTFIGTIVPPLERAPASNPRIVDSFGNAITGAVKVGQQIQVTADLANGQDRDQPFAYLVQIQDASGVTVSLSWITGTLTAGQSLNPAQSWTPSTAGTYNAQIFVWQSIDNPNALSPPLSTTITVQ